MEKDSKNEQWLLNAKIFGLFLCQKNIRQRRSPKITKKNELIYYAVATVWRAVMIFLSERNSEFKMRVDERSKNASNPP